MHASIPRAVAYARALLGVSLRHQAEDVVQESLCRLIVKAWRYDLVRDGERLLFRSVSNACINAATRRRELASLDAAADDAPAPASLLAGDPADEPMHRLLSAELAERVAAAIAELPSLQRAVMALRAFDHPPNRIAATLDLSPGHVAVLTFRARRTLAVRLADVLDVEP